MTSTTLTIGQTRQSHLFGPIRITTVLRQQGERVVHCRTLDGKAALILSPRYCARLPLVNHV